MDSAIRMQFQGATRARVRLEPDGRVIVSCDMTDIGTGTYTIAAQVAANTLKVPIERIMVELARSDYPETAGSGGSWGAPNTSVAIQRACEMLRQELDEARHQGAIEATGETRSMGDDPNYKKYSQNTYGPASRKLRSTTRLAKCGCAECWACSLPGALSIRKLRDRS